jgi:NADPH-dependent 2,4-dienoyl-CoA reductase/sulfur reductase-like enzyme
MNVLVAGGGIAALEFVHALKDLAGEARVTLVAPEEEFVPRPLLVPEPFGSIPRERRRLAELAQELGFTHVRGTISGVEAHARRVTLRGGGTLTYDTLVLAPGAKRLPAFEDALHLGHDTLDALYDEIERGDVRTVAVVAPTTTGWLVPLYDAALSTARLGAQVTFTGHAPDDVQAALRRAGVELTPDAPNADRLISLPLIRGPRIPGVPATGLYGLIPVDEYMRVKGVEHIYAIGDATDHPVKQGVIACRQAQTAAAHVAHPTVSFGAPQEGLLTG